MELVNFKRVLAHAKRRCPHCGSGSWERIETVPDTVEAVEKALLVQYRCEKCGEDFVAEEAKGAVYVEDASACCHCGSRKVVQTSREGADMRLFVCLQCHGWMGVKPELVQKPSNSNQQATQNQFALNRNKP